MISSEKQLPVYVVDDDESVRDSLAFMLEEHDFNVTTFADGQSFLDEVNIHQAGCVILDSRMPNLRGQQVHQFLNEAHSPLAVIYLTGHGDVPMAVDALQAGAVNFFQNQLKAMNWLKQYYMVRCSRRRASIWWRQERRMNH